MFVHSYRSWLCYIRLQGSRTASHFIFVRTVCVQLCAIISFLVSTVRRVSRSEVRCSPINDSLLDLKRRQHAPKKPYTAVGKRAGRKRSARSTSTLSCTAVELAESQRISSIHPMQCILFPLACANPTPKLTNTLSLRDRARRKGNTAMWGKQSAVETDGAEDGMEARTSKQRRLRYFDDQEHRSQDVECRRGSSSFPL